MITQERLHESEEFTVSFDAVDGSAVLRHFAGLGATLTDDFFDLRRPGDVPPWQAIGYWSADCYLSDAQVYPDESTVDSIRFTYLFASLPFDCFTAFASTLERTLQAFDGRLSYSSSTIAFTDVSALADQWLDDLRTEVAEEPGSESLAVLIQELFYQ